LPKLLLYVTQNSFLVRKKSFYSACFVTSCFDWQIAGNTVREYTKTTEDSKDTKAIRIIQKLERTGWAAVYKRKAYMEMLNERWHYE
jgi:hypothetical protein